MLWTRSAKRTFGADVADPSVLLDKVSCITQPGTRLALTHLSIVVCFLLIYETDGDVQHLNKFIG